MCLQGCVAEVLQTLKFRCENTQTPQTLQETEGNYISMLHKKNTVQSHGCNEYINIRKDVQMKLYKMGPNWRTSLAMLRCVTCSFTLHVFTFTICICFLL